MSAAALAQYQVHSDIPMPHPEAKGYGRPSKYQWATMKVGDMFFVPYGSEDPMDVAARLNSLVHIRNKRGAEKYQKRVFTLDGVGGIGVWRIK